MIRPQARFALLIVSLLALNLSLLTACSSDSQFEEPTDPVAQVPWPDFERLHYDMLDQTDSKLGTLILETAREDDRYRLTLEFALQNEDGPVSDRVRVWVDAETLQPISYERIATSAEQSLNASATYTFNAAGEATADINLNDNGEILAETIEAGRFAFDNDSSAWLWRSLAFAQDLELTYRSVNVVQARSQLVQVAVRGQDTLRGPDGDVVVWQVVATPGVEVSRTWYEVDPPHRLIRWDQQPRRFVLTRIESEP